MRSTMLDLDTVGGSWLVQATVSHTRDGWTTSRQIPSFILPGDILGIIGEAHAKRVAESMLAEIAGVTLHSVAVTVTRTV